MIIDDLNPVTEGHEGRNKTLWRRPDIKGQYRDINIGIFGRRYLYKGLGRRAWLREEAIKVLENHVLELSYYLFFCGLMEKC